MNAIRDDLRLAAYAVALKYSLRGPGGMPLEAATFATNGTPYNGLQFVLGDVSVWDTSRGWRVARLVDGKFEHAQDSDFYKRLKDALDEGARNWRDR